MSDAFLIEYFDGTDLVRIDPDGALTVGTPIVSGPELLYDGQLVPGWYDLAFSAVVPGVSATVTVTAPSDNYAQNGRVITGVGLLGSGGAWQYDVIRGVRMKFSSAGGFLSSWKARVHVGAYLGAISAGNPDGVTNDQTAGYADPGVSAGNGSGAQSAIEIWKITNTSGKRAANVFAQIVPFPAVVPTSGKVFSYLFITTNEPVEKEAGTPGQEIEPYAITLDNFNSTPTPDEVDLLVDGALIASGVQNMDSGALGSSAALEIGTQYKFTTGALAGVEFILDTSIVDATPTCDLYICEPRWSEITPSTGGGSPTSRPNDGVEDGTTWGTSDVGLTEIGEPTREIANSGSVLLFRRTTVPAGAPFGKNPAIQQGFVIKAALSTASGY